MTDSKIDALISNMSRVFNQKIENRFLKLYKKSRSSKEVANSITFGIRNFNIMIELVSTIDIF